MEVISYNSLLKTGPTTLLRVSKINVIIQEIGSCAIMLYAAVFECVSRSVKAESVHLTTTLGSNCALSKLLVAENFVYKLFGKQCSTVLTSGVGG